MSHGCEAARGSFTQLGLWLPLTALKPEAKDLLKWLEDASRGKGGMLLGGASRPRVPATTLAWEKDMTAAVAAARKAKSGAP